MTIVLLAALAAAQPALPTEKQAEEAVRAMRAEFARSDNSGKIGAVHLALATLHERVIRSVGELFQSEPDEVRIGVAGALAAADHPASVAALVAGLAANERRPAVASAVCKALGELGWQKAAPALEACIRRAASPDVRAFLPEAFAALGRLGATSSIPPLLDFLRLLENPKHEPLPGEKGLRRAAEAALRAVAGAEFRDAAEAEAWWKANSAALLAAARKTVWSRKTGERSELLAAEKTPADVDVVAVRITEPAADPKPKRKNKKP